MLTDIADLLRHKQRMLGRLDNAWAENERQITAAKGTVNMTGKILAPSKPAPKPIKSGTKTKPAPAQTVAIQVQMQMGNSLIE